MFPACLGPPIAPTGCFCNHGLKAKVTTPGMANEYYDLVP
jgi:hypothetical protein